MICVLWTAQAERITMGFNYGLEKKKFDEEWEKLRKEYEAAGMTAESIKEIYEYDSFAIFCDSHLVASSIWSLGMTLNCPE